MLRIRFSPPQKMQPHSVAVLIPLFHPSINFDSKAKPNRHKTCYDSFKIGWEKNDTNNA